MRDIASAPSQTSILAVSTAFSQYPSYCIAAFSETDSIIISVAETVDQTQTTLKQRQK
jgi:hypothetical protein